MGTEVTITGRNFGDAQGSSTVTFNGTPGTSIAQWSSTSIETTVPAGATTGPVVVTVKGVASNGVLLAVLSGSNDTYNSSNELTSTASASFA